jgi:RimJ/RimL family protein N-acetyltransferase
VEPFELPAGDVLLRPWREDDVPAAWAALQDPGMRRWNSSGSGSVEAVAELLARRRDWSGGDHASWAVVPAGGGELLGSMSLHAIDRVQGNAEVGYWTVPAARGRGVAVAATVAAVSWAFRELPVDRVQLFHAVENPASGRVAAKAGFTLEGRLRRSFRYGDGEKHDELLWARLTTDPPVTVR